MNSGSAVKLIVDALLERFLPLARRRIETAQLQDGQYLWPSDPAYESILDSLAMVAQHTPVPVLEALLRWRESCIAVNPQRVKMMHRQFKERWLLNAFVALHVFPLSTAVPRRDLQKNFGLGLKILSSTG